jgi:hypothetical protein
MSKFPIKIDGTKLFYREFFVPGVRADKVSTQEN